MNAFPHLDRLSALLEGLAPRVTLHKLAMGGDGLTYAGSPVGFLHLHLLLSERKRFSGPTFTTFERSGPAIVLIRSDCPHQVSALGAGSDGEHLSANVHVDGPVAALLLAEFDQPRTVALDAGELALEQTMRLIATEVRSPRCGQPALLDRAGDILFIGLLRHFIAQPVGGAGLLSGLADPRIARALVAMHDRPQWAWTLEALAEAAGMSRTAFANTFRAVMQETPGRYLTRIRLSIAQRAVQAGKGLKAAARESGYGNTSALSRALSRQSAVVAVT